MQIESITTATLIGTLSATIGYIIRMLIEKSTNNSLQIEIARKNEELNYITKQLSEIKNTHEATLLNLETSWKNYSKTSIDLLTKSKDAEIENAKNTRCPFRVKIIPFAEYVKDKGIFTDTHIYQRGFRYQLFVSGVPCFEPHCIIDERHEESEFNHEKLQTLANIACDSAKKFVSQQASTGAAFIDIAETKISRLSR